MGIQDRDYYRNTSFQTNSYSQGHSAVFYIIVINVGLWLLDAFTGYKVTEYGALCAENFVQPLQWYRFLTYGFCHASEPMHVIGNMIGLFFLGRSVEARYGKREFLFFYLISIIIGGIYWSGTSYWTWMTLHETLGPLEQLQLLKTPLVGASGGVTAVVILFAFNFPRVSVYLFGILPMPAFVFGIFLVVMDLMGAKNQGTNVAHSVHLAGAAFAAIYFLTRFRFCSIFGHGGARARLWSESSQTSQRKRYDGGYGGASEYNDPDDYVDDSYGYAPASKTSEEIREEEDFRRLQADVEILLKKISQFGMQSLTPEEVARLREASQKYKNRQ